MHERDHKQLDRATKYEPPEGAKLIAGRPKTKQGYPIQVGEIWLEVNEPDTIVFVFVNGTRNYGLGLSDWTRYSVYPQMRTTELYISSTKHELHGKKDTLTGLDHTEWEDIAQEIVELAKSD